MTVKEAYKILGLPSGTEFHEIKRKYRKLMMQVHPDVSDHVSQHLAGSVDHPDSQEHYTYSAQELNTAYSTLKEKYFTDTENENHSQKDCSAEEQQNIMWNAPINQNAYRDREVLQYVTDYDGTVLGNFCVARGKYLWTTEEDFPLFLLSMYRCSKELLDETDTSLDRKEAPTNRSRIQTELTYLLAQQFIAGTALLEELAKEEHNSQDGCKIFYISSMLESSNNADTLKSGEALYPYRIRQHRLYLKNQAGQEVGYLSFSDDRLYYIVIPLFEQKAVQIKIQAAEKQPETKRKTTVKYQNLHVWIKLRDKNISQLPENLNLQIEQLLEKYRS